MLVDAPIDSSLPDDRSSLSGGGVLVPVTTSLTSFNPFSEEDEHDQTGYALVSSLFSRVRTSISTAVGGHGHGHSSNTAISLTFGSPTAGSNGMDSTTTTTTITTSNIHSPRPASNSISTFTDGLGFNLNILSTSSNPITSTAITTNSTSVTNGTTSSKPPSTPFPILSKSTKPPEPAPPLVSLTPVVSELPTFQNEDLYENDRDYRERERPSSSFSYYHSYSTTPLSASGQGLPGYPSPTDAEAPFYTSYGTSIPGFPIPDDARSVRTSTSGVGVGNVGVQIQRADSLRSKPVSKVIRKIRGEGLSKQYWMDDKNCRECYDCKSVFTTWRRKHHCRICGQIFCARCASNVIKGIKFGKEGTIRVCNLCLEKLETGEDEGTSGMTEKGGERSYEATGWGEEEDEIEEDRRSLFSLFAPHQHGQNPSSKVSLNQSYLFGSSGNGTPGTTTPYPYPHTHHPSGHAYANPYPYPYPASHPHLYAISEARRRVISFGSDEGSYSGKERPLTPGDEHNMGIVWDENLGGIGSSAGVGFGSIGKAAPFRRPILDLDEDPPSATATSKDQFSTPLRAGDQGRRSVTKSPSPILNLDDQLPTVDVPISVEESSGSLPVSTSSTSLASDVTTTPPNQNAKSTIQFPGTSPERHHFPMSHSQSSSHPIPFPQQHFGSFSINTPRRMSILRTRVNSYADDGGIPFPASAGGNGVVCPPPFLRSRVQSRMSDNFDGMGDAGWRTRRESTYAQELNALSMFHLRIMLRQMLTKENVPNIQEWEETLFGLSLQVSRDLSFTSYQREGPDMDARRYVKIKKIPGGSPADSEYVDGAVITKNVAHKQMSRLQKNVRIMLVTFPLDFQRVEGKYIPFGQVLTQEQQYIENLTSRISDFRPHLVLVEKSVSRLALESLVKHGIAVARSVKPSAVSFVARMTQGDLISSMDKLALEPRLGHCSRYRIQTFDHPLIPGRRKTYMRFEGCGRNMGCTIILRGGSMDLLRRIKNVTRFLIFVVRNLKMETSLWKDAVITLPLLTSDAIPIPGPMRPRTLSFGSLNLLNMGDPPAKWAPPVLKEASLRTGSAIELEDTEESSASGTPSLLKSDDEKDLPADDLQRKQLSRRIQESIEPYEKVFISVSATLRFQPPQPIRHMKELDDKLKELRKAWEDREVLHGERTASVGTVSHERELTLTTTNTTSEMSTPGQTPILGESVVRIMNPGLAEDYFGPQVHSASSFSSLNESQTPPLYQADMPKARGDSIDQSTISSSQSSLVSVRDSIASLVLPSPGYEDVAPSPMMALKQNVDIAEESALSLVQLQHDEHRRVWEWYLRKNKDDFNVDKYQNIFIREYIAPITDEGLGRSCFLPKLTHITFYGENDCMLGQYIEKAVSEGRAQLHDPKAICAGKSCERPVLAHCRVYVHGEHMISITVEETDAAKTGYCPYPDVMVTWSFCRVCSIVAPCLPVSEEMQKYSFAKFLELHFYPADVTLTPEMNCCHNIYQNHIRYIAYKGISVAIQTDPVVLHEIIFPPMRIRVRPESLLQLKNTDYERMHMKNLMWYSSLIDDLRFITMDSTTGDEEADVRLLHDVNLLINRAEAERNEIANMIHKVYCDTKATDTLALNSVRRHRQDKMVAWQQDFDRLPKPKPIQFTDKEKRTTTFGSVRNIFPKRSELVGLFEQFPPGKDSDVDSVNLRRRIVSDPSTSASESESVVDNIQDKLASIMQQKATETGSSSNQTLREQIGSLGSEVNKLPPVDEYVKSEAESDDTIGACRGNGTVKEKDACETSDRTPEAQTLPTLLPSPELLEVENEDKSDDKTLPPISRLPRPSENSRKVAELIKQYQSPQQVVTPLEIPHEDTETFGNIPIESEADSEIPPIKIRDAPRVKLHKRRPFAEHDESYAANIAPKYLSHAHRRHVGSRIPAPISYVHESRESSRQASPDKRFFSEGRGPIRGSTVTAPTKSSRGKATIRPISRDKTGTLRPSPAGGRPTTRRKSSYTQNGKVGTLARQFEKIARENDRFNRRYSVIRGRRARPVASAKAKVEVFENVRDAILDESESSDASEADDEQEHGEDEGTKAKDEPLSRSEESISSNTGSTSSPPQSSDAEAKSPIGPAPSPPITIPETTAPPPTPSQPEPCSAPSNLPAMEQHPEVEYSGSVPDRQTIMQAFSKLLPQQISTRFIPEPEMEDPLADPEHIFRESDIVVRTDEPTSIIALTLDSPKYKEDLLKQQSEKRPPRVEASETFMPDDVTMTDSNSNWGVVNFDRGEDSATEPARPIHKSPIQYTFESSGITITCTVLFAEQFDSLRRAYDCDKSMIESLARCVKWDNSGGKSGSGFLKTKDDRFIAKELSKTELNAMETFAPAYFDYMANAVAAGRPTLLAKIFGCYKITFKQANDSKSKNKARRMNLLVMENLFYDRRFSKIYDLKGSTRNRHVQSTGRENEVLLDENLVQNAYLSPFYLREHSKRILRGALWNDSKFLADLNVMDYSLVVGVDTLHDELVVGIVDYIRTYTWDKKLETWVKESAFLGGPGRGEPTIVTPKQYKARFRSAMERYFPLVPDRWMKQRDAPDEEGDPLLDLWPDW